MRIRARRYLAVWLALAVVAIPSQAEAASAPGMIQLLPGPVASNYLWFVGELNGKALFSADTGNGKGAELWRTDGTAAGTHFVDDINSGPNGSQIDPGSVRLGNSLYFEADDGIHGEELWHSDGTPHGTGLVRDINPGPDTSIAIPSAVLGGKLYFSASDGSVTGKHGIELWRTAGTPASTRLVKDTAPGTADGYPVYIRTVGQRLLFIANDGITGEELWVSDGSHAGTHLLKDINEEGSIIGYPGAGMVTVFKGKYYFLANDGTSGDPGDHGSELWRSDGTAGGTKLFKEFVPGVGGTNIQWFQVVGNRLYFSATNSHGVELWVTDGTRSGTRRLTDIMPGSGSSNPYPIASIGHVLYFGATDASHGTELWRTNGTIAGTRMVRDILKGSTGSFPGSGVAVNGKVVFTATTSLGAELWQTDGTKAGTRLVQDIAPGPASSQPYGLMALGTRVLFFADDGTHGLELWRYRP